MDTQLRRLNYRAIVVAAIAAFAFSLIWYSPFVFGSVWVDAKGAEATAMPAWKFVVAPLRELITAWLLAWLIGRLGIVQLEGRGLSRPSAVARLLCGAALGRRDLRRDARRPRRCSCR